MSGNSPLSVWILNARDFNRDLGNWLVALRAWTADRRLPPAQIIEDCNALIVRLDFLLDKLHDLSNPASTIPQHHRIFLQDCRDPFVNTHNGLTKFLTGMMGDADLRDTHRENLYQFGDLLSVEHHSQVMILETAPNA